MDYMFDPDKQFELNEVEDDLGLYMFMIKQRTKERVGSAGSDIKSTDNSELGITGFATDFGVIPRTNSMVEVPNNSAEP